jgi:3-hydroxyacyl-[acyl-carrier-protein] dehydratase
MRFFMIDRINSWIVGKSAEAIKNITLSEDFFNDHFPRRPVMPGVLIIEGMAQLAGLLLEVTLKRQHGKDAKAVLTVLERTKFRDMARPGDTLTYRTEIISVNESGGKAAVKAFLGEKLIASTEMVFGFKRVDDPKLDQVRNSLLQMWLKCGGSEEHAAN